MLLGDQFNMFIFALGSHSTVYATCHRSSDEHALCGSLPLHTP